MKSVDKTSSANEIVPLSPSRRYNLWQVLTPTVYHRELISWRDCETSIHHLPSEPRSISWLILDADMSSLAGNATRNRANAHILTLIGWLSRECSFLTSNGTSLLQVHELLPLEYWYLLLLMCSLISSHNLRLTQTCQPQSFRSVIHLLSRQNTAAVRLALASAFHLRLTYS